jgi:redox-sensitive bicupin YhaK (pirin superfamily)
VTIVTNGVVDHSDSLGAAGRFGFGDVQWMTAGKGVQHCEMFPLVEKDKENPLELFQIWLNLPKAKKFASPHFAMLWNDTIPEVVMTDINGLTTKVRVIAGQLQEARAPLPAPDSWAADPHNEVAIWTIQLEAGAQWKLPAASAMVNRSLYFYSGTSIQIASKNFSSHQAIELYADQEVTIINGEVDSHLLLLQGRPINEPIAQYGPFVMNTQAEIQQAMNEYRQTEFGGWPWPSHEHVHPKDKGRFARYPNGVEEVRS